MGEFGNLSHLVKPCRLAARHARIAIHGGGGSGKTYSALQLARGLLGPGGRIVLLSLGENRAEELYAGVCDFWHIDCTHSDVTAAAKARFPTARGGLPWEGEGCDPRAVLHALQQVAPGAGLGGVVIIDSMSEAWDGVKGRVDTFTGGQESKNRFAWAAVAPIEAALWDAVETIPCHTIVTVRAKTAVHIEERGKTKVPVHVPTDPELRNRNEFRMDVRIFVDSEHRARFAGRLTAVNGSEVPLLTPEIGTRIKQLLGGDPAARTGAHLDVPDAEIEETDRLLDEHIAESKREGWVSPAAKADPPAPLPGSARLAELATALAMLIPRAKAGHALVYYLAASGKSGAATKIAATAWADGLDERAWRVVSGNIVAAFLARLRGVVPAQDPEGLGFLLGLDHGAEAQRAGLESDPARWPVGAAWGVALASAGRAEKAAKKAPKAGPGETALRKALEVPGGEEAVRRALAQVDVPWPETDQGMGGLAYIIGKVCESSQGADDTVGLLVEHFDHEAAEGAL